MQKLDHMSDQTSPTAKSKVVKWLKAESSDQIFFLWRLLLLSCKDLEAGKTIGGRYSYSLIHSASILSYFLSERQMACPLVFLILPEGDRKKKNK